MRGVALGRGRGELYRINSNHVLGHTCGERRETDIYQHRNVMTYVCQIVLFPERGDAVLEILHWDLSELDLLTLIVAVT